MRKSKWSMDRTQFLSSKDATIVRDIWFLTSDPSHLLRINIFYFLISLFAFICVIWISNYIIRCIIYMVMVSEKIKVMLNYEKHPKRGVNWVFKKLFKHNKFKHNINKNKEIELENSNSGFIVVRHFLAYVHSPQSFNRVRIPLT